MEPANLDLYTNSTNLSPDKKKNTSNSLAPIISVTVFVLLALGVVVFLYNQNQFLKKELANYQSTPTPTQSSTPIPTSLDLPIVSTPSAKSKVKSPLMVTGTVPSGWMFEGSFPIKLIDSEKNIIAQTQAEEVTPGSWQEEGPVKFTGTLTFKAATGSGTLVLENDNPSGNAENAKTFEIPVTF